MLITLLTSCQKSDDPQPDPRQEIDLNTLTQAMEKWQWDLFQQSLVQSQEDGNMAVSPLSVAAALYMTLQGADGDTRAEMEAALELQGINGASLGKSYRQLVEALTQTEDATHLQLANAIFWDQGRIAPHQDFLTYNEEYFEAEQLPLDFTRPEALTTINQWVDHATEGRIDKILDEISAEEVMFIINALFFTGDWKYPFPPESTSDQPFTLADGSTTLVPMMYQDSYGASFVKGEAFDAVDMPFADTSYSMTFVLPPPQVSLNDFIAGFSADDLDDLYASLRTGRIFLHLPRFSMSYKQLLNETLKGMGMELAFDPQQADFSRLGQAPEGNLFISKVLHKTFLKIDEKGAEGAAVTSVGVGVTSLPPSIRFDRPFLFLIRHKDTGAILFAGKMEAPESA